MIIHLSKLLKFIFRKSHYVNFWSNNGTYPAEIRGFKFTTVDYLAYCTFKITLSSIGCEWKKSVDVLSLSSFCTAIYKWDLFHQMVRGLAFHQCIFHFDSMYGGLDTHTVLTTWTLLRKDPWMSESLENDSCSSGSVAYLFAINWDGRKWITIINFTLWHDLRLKHCHPPFLRIVFRHMFW